MKKLHPEKNQIRFKENKTELKIVHGESNQILN